ncbi:hypothetical protein KAR29_13450 [Aminithiophilus ramosus]|uniref:Uncharacterized protein n=2 Tax=Synergistales TaxID=649776 RepID=A0A9Q7EV89_9BACT|nr:hypothetical protein [Aminithiophilus ramosus]QTX32288.1 hypothetical protein KAR29_13450 [Aminithiophilus ramosus]QVL36155.1 hypothetical protein KIH16_13650 [Synergistota bacterium]
MATMMRPMAAEEPVFLERGPGAPVQKGLLGHEGLVEIAVAVEDEALSHESLLVNPFHEISVDDAGRADGKGRHADDAPKRHISKSDPLTVLRRRRERLRRFIILHDSPTDEKVEGVTD